MRGDVVFGATVPSYCGAQIDRKGGEGKTKEVLAAALTKKALSLTTHIQYKTKQNKTSFNA